ncbi:unnamed protein product [Ectocarpus sp. 4 AP-2014]
MRRSRGVVRGEAGGSNGVTGRTGRRSEGMLMRSVSDTLGAELLDVDGASTSSSDEERDGPAALARTPAGSSFDGSQQRSPKSTSESPDAIMRSRMVGFGSTDVRKSKRAGKGSSIIPTWARFSDFSERRGPSPAAAAAVAAAAAAPTSASATQPASRLKNTGLAIEGKADVEENAGEGVSAEGLRHKSSSSDPSTTTTTTLFGGGHDSLSGPLAVRKEDRLTAESLRRPASAPAGVLATDAKESPLAFQDPAPAQPSRASSKSRPVNSSPPERHGRASPPLGRGRVNPSQLLPPAGTGTGGTGGGGSGGALQNEAFAFSRRPELSPTVARSSNTTAPATPAAVLSPQPPELAPPPKPKGAVPAFEPRIVDKRKIPPLARPVAADPPPSQRQQQQQQQQQGPPAVKVTPPPPDAAAVAQKRFEAIYRDSSYDSSDSPPLSTTVDRLESFGTSRTDSFGPPNSDKSVGKLTIQPALSPDVYAAPSEAGTTMTCDSGSLPFAPTPAAVAADTAARAAFNGSRGSRGSMVSYGSRGSGGTDCTSPGSPPGGAVGEARASIYLPTAGVRAIPAMSGLHLSGGAPRDEAAQGPSGFEELWAVLEPTWDINSSFGASCAPKAMLLGGVYEKLRSFQAAVSSVCVRACGPVLGEVCRRCARAWAVLISRSVQDIVECTDLVRKIESSVLQLIDVVERYRASAVVRRFTLPLIGVATAWEEILAGGEGGDLQEPCARIEKAVAQLSEKGGEGGKRSGSGAGAGADGSAGGGGGSSRPGRRGSFSMDLKLPPCPSYWAKGQFDQLTPNRLADVLTLLHEPARFAELAELVTHASDVGPASRDYSAAWNCVRRAEGPALGRELRRALSATLVAAGELLPLPRVPPPPPAYVPREKLTEQIEATILHPFLPLGIAGIGGPSGSGKTVLAAAVVRDATVRCRFGDRVFWLHAGKGANHRLVSVLQGLADTVYSWLTDDEHGGGASSSAFPRRSVGSGGGGSDAGGGGGDAGAALVDPNLREPVRFRDQDQAVNYVADLCRGPLLAGLRCLVVVDDVHEREVVDALWKSGCQLLVTSPVKGLLQAVGAEATVAQPLGVEVARQLATRAAGEVALCEEGGRLVDLCRGCPLALAMSGAITQAVFSGGSDAREYRKPGLVTPRPAIGEDTAAGGGGGGSGKEEEPSTWSFSTLAAPVGAWVEQVVVGTSGSPPTNRQRQGGDAPSSRDKGRPAATGPGEDVRGVAGAGGDGAVAGAVAATAVAVATTGAAAAAAATVPGHELGPEATAWANLARRVDAALARLGPSRSALCGLLAEAGPEQELPVRQLVAVLTELALQEADRILGGSRWALECYLSFALLPEGHPLPPPALEEFWRSGRGAEERAAAGRGGSSFAAAHNLPSPVEVFEALRMVCRAGGGEGADGLVLHGLQRAVVSCLALRHPEAMQKAARRRARTLSRISSLVGTFDDACWGLRGADVGAGGASGGDDSSGGEGVAGAIPSGLLGSGRPGPLHHGYGGFSRYDYLVASWDALPAPYSLTSAVAGYVSSVRTAYRAAAAAAAAAAALVSSGGNKGEGGAEGAAAAAAGGAGGWAAARALASAADMLALAGQRSRAIAVYEEACGLLAEEAARAAGMVGVPQKERAARESHHKVASMLRELAMLAAQFEREAPAIRLLQRAVEVHLSALEASGVLVPHFAGGNEHRSKLKADGGDAAVAAAAAAAEAQGRGADVTYRAVVDDARPLCSRLWLQFPVGTRERAASAGRGDGSGGGGGNGNLPAFGRLDVVGTCVGDLGLVLACTRVLRQEEKVDESAQLAEKVYPVLKEILGADHAFTKAALAAFVGQGIVDQCWKKADVHGSGSSGGHPSLPTPTSRRRLARSSGGRGASAAGGSAGASAAQSTAGSSSLAATTLSDLSLPPSPLPEEFYARYSSSVNSANSGRGDAPADGHGGNGGGGRGRGRSNSGFSNSGSVTSGTEGDDGGDSDSDGSGAIGGHRRAGPVGGSAYGSLSFPRRVLNGGRQEHGWRREGAHGWGQGEAAAAASSSSGGVGGRGGGGVEPASSRMQQEIYFRHRTRRARAHAFLITAATRARLKNADRDEAGLFLRDLGRQAGATSSSNNGGGGGGGGREGVAGLAVSPDGTPQMARLTRRS